MATFEEVVKQLQMNNRSEAGRDSRHTKMIGDLKTAIEGLTVATEEGNEPDSAEEENQKDERSRARKLLDAVGGLKDSIGTAFTNLGKLETGIPGLTLGLLAKLAVIPLLVKFLQSDVWDKIKAFLLDPSFKELGNLFEEYTVEMTTLLAVVGGFAIVKLVNLATSVGAAFSSIATGLTTLGAALGIGSVAAAGTIVAIVAGIALTAKGLYDAFLTFSDTFKETGSIMESLKEAAIEFVGTVVGLPFDLLKNISAYLAEQLGFENFADTLREFSVEDMVKNTTRKIFGFFEEFFGNITKIFSGDTMQERLDGLFGTLSGIGDIILAPLNLVLDTVRGFFSLAGIDLPEFKIQDLIKGLFDEITELFTKVLSIDVSEIFDEAKQKVLDAIEKVKASIPTPDFSIIGQKITDLANFFSPTRILTSIGDSINERFQPDGIVGKLTKKAIMKIFPTSPVEVDEPVIGGGSMQVREAGGFLGAKQFALVGEQGPELIMSKAPMQVFSEQRTDQLGMAALNRLTGGGDAGGGGSMFINQGNNVQNVSRSISPTFIVNQDTVLTSISKSLAM